ncbi:hypothetical protein B484DRAFT_410517, partial [Ochromonadaceae sp. CCMP2298]
MTGPTLAPTSAAQTRLSPLTISPDDEENILSVTIRFHSTDPNVTVYFTLDGTAPSHRSPSILPNAPLLLNAIGRRTVRAVAVREGALDSIAVSKIYTILDRCQAPVLSPPGGTYEGSVTVTLTTATAGASICYQVDPSSSSGGGGFHQCLLSGESVLLSTPGSSVLSAVASAAGKADSPSIAASFSVLAQVATPIILPLLDTFPISALLTFTCATPGATIYYTTDGSTPSQSSLTVQNGESVVIDIVGANT